MNLALFLSSFFLLVFTSLQVSQNKSSASSSEAQITQSNIGFDSNSQQLSENNEFEDDSDDDFEMASFTMPFLVSFEQFEIISAISPSFQFKFETFQEAIYLAIHNFRI